MKGSVSPVSPKKVKQVISFPVEVIESFNELIEEKFNGNSNSSTIKQDAVVERILQKNPKITKDELIDKHWLDVEDVYRKAGWIVKFDQPGYCESYDAYFVFEKKTKIKRIVTATLEIG